MMNLINEFILKIQITIIFSIIYLLISTVIVLLIPKHNLFKFISLPKSNLNSKLNKALYWIILGVIIFLPASNIIFMKYLGIFMFIAGLLMYLVSMFYFSISEYDKPVTEKIYSISRHPVYLSFFIMIIGVSIFSGSFILIFLSIIHFISSIFIMKEEEIFCENKYGDVYKEYKKKVRMIL